MLFIGIDVAAEKKGQALAVLTQNLQVTHLVSGLDQDQLQQEVVSLDERELIVAIDSPRRPPNNPGGKWGRECDRELHRRGVRLQWTPPRDLFTRNEVGKEWMRVGFQLFEMFEDLQDHGRLTKVIEVFPSASYGRFPDLNLGVTIPFGLIDRRAKADQLDAICCALTAWCYENGHYEAVGDPEEGQIIIPRQ